MSGWGVVVGGMARGGVGAGEPCHCFKLGLGSQERGSVWVELS